MIVCIIFKYIMETVASSVWRIHPDWEPGVFEWQLSAAVLLFPGRC